MNQYGRLAQTHWRRFAPTRYATLQDPEAYFEELGETIAGQVDQLAQQMEAQLPAGLDYLDRVGQMNAIRKQAEETVLAETVYVEPTETSNLREELEELLGDLPTARMLGESLNRMREELEDRADLEGQDPSNPAMTADEDLRWTQLSALRALLDPEPTPDQMSEAEIRDLILALSPFHDPETRALTQPL